MDFVLGQTLEDLRRRGINPEEEVFSHMRNKKFNRLGDARYGYILNPGPNGIYDATYTGKYIKGSLAEEFKFDGIGKLNTCPVLDRFRVIQSH